MSMRITVLDHGNMKLLLLALLLVAAPHALHLPLWLSAAIVGTGLWRWWAALRGRNLPSVKLRFIATTIVVALVLIQYSGFSSHEAGIALLLAMTALKLTELRQRRDVLALIFLSYFILVTLFLFDQSIPMAAYVFTITWLLLALHIHLSHGQAQPHRPSLKLAATLIGQAIPLMIALFLLFPRLPGPMWSLPSHEQSGQTGLDSRLEMGGISNLVESDEIVFRVQFTGPVPTSGQRYWRGPVLNMSNGRDWFAVPIYHEPDWQQPAIQYRGEAIDYSITLEPHGRNWLLGLDLVQPQSQEYEFSNDYQLLSATSVTERQVYALRSYSEYYTGAINPAEWRLNLRLASQRNPRTVELGRQLRMDAVSDRETVSHALQMFRQDDYTYTLQPPLLASQHPVDEFLFTSKRGFCEHFAASFVTLMRAAGIPARIVTGYQGGELNTVGNYLTIRQRDAHAWAEVWLEDSGWLRVDPTAAVAPERIERSIDTGGSSSGRVLFSPQQLSALASMARQLQQNIDAINYAWNLWVLGYDSVTQSDFFDTLGIDIKDWRQLAWSFGIVIGSLIAIIAAFILLKRERINDPLQRAYLQYCRKLARLGCERQDNETASDYAQRIAQQQPQLAIKVEEIADEYNALRYGENTSPILMRKLILTIKKIKT